nr:MAG TPA: hypothetical protein [Caudoviricetes sp.]
MATNPQGIWVYSPNDVIQSWPAFMNLGFNSVSDVIKQLQQNRILIAKNPADESAKLSAIKSAASNVVDILIYRADTNEMYLYTNNRSEKVWGGAPDVRYVNNNESFSQWRRYTQHGASATINQMIDLPSKGLWLFSNCITLDNNNSSKDTNIDVFQSIANAQFVNVGTTNTYNHAEGVTSFRMATMPYYAYSPGKVNVAVKIQCSPVNNIGWGGLCIGASKIG